MSWSIALIASREPLILLSAPAGYGKTTLLRQWIERDDRPVAWVQLEALRDDPVALLCYLAEALGEFAPLDPESRRLLGVRDAPIEQRVLPGLSAAAEAATPFLLLLDDAHHLTRDTCWRCVGVLQTADGIAFDAFGGLWIATDSGTTGASPSGGLYRLTPCAGLWTIADDPGWLNYPTTPVFGTGQGDRCTLYVEDGAFLGFDDGSSPDIGALRVAIPGLPLWRAADRRRRNHGTHRLHDVRDAASDLLSRH